MSALRKIGDWGFFSRRNKMRRLRQIRPMQINVKRILSTGISQMSVDLVVRGLDRPS
jgi:hypothetical protein